MESEILLSFFFSFPSRGADEGKICHEKLVGRRYLYLLMPAFCSGNDVYTLLEALHVYIRVEKKGRKTQRVAMKIVYVYEMLLNLFTFEFFICDVHHCFFYVSKSSGKE